MIFGIDVDHTIAYSEPKINEYLLRVSPNSQLNYSEYHKGVEKTVMYRALDLMVYEGVFMNLAPVKNAVYAMNEIKSRGHIIHYVTNRYKCYSKNLRKAQAELLVWLEKNKFPFLENSTVVNSDIEDKGTLCKRLGVDILIDDLPKNLGYAEKAGIGCILYTAPWNKSCKLYDRIDSW